MPGHGTNIREGGYQPVSDPEPIARDRPIPANAINPFTGNPQSGTQPLPPEPVASDVPRAEEGAPEP